MFIPRVPSVTDTRPGPSATRLPEHGRWQRALRRAAAGLSERLPGFRGRYTPDRLVDAADAAGTRAGRRQRLKDSPHLGQIVDIYV